VKTAIFCTCGSNNWENVENRWVHAARGLASIELSFIRATYCVIIAGASPGDTKMLAAVHENSDFWTYALT